MKWCLVYILHNQFMMIKAKEGNMNGLAVSGRGQTSKHYRKKMSTCLGWALTTYVVLHTYVSGIQVSGINYELNFKYRKLTFQTVIEKKKITFININARASSMNLISKSFHFIIILT